MIESPLPVERGEVLDRRRRKGPRAHDDHWDATFDANGVSDASKKISDIFFAGLKSIKQKVQGTAGGDWKRQLEQLGGAQRSYHRLLVRHRALRGTNLEGARLARVRHGAAT
jgi:hypothetical protein